MKSGQRKDSLVKCPHYKKESRQRIICGGIQEGARTHLTFDNATDWKDYKKDRCKGDWEKCPIAGLLNNYDF